MRADMHHIFRRKAGYKVWLYYVRFIYWQDRKRRTYPVGYDEQAAIKKRDELLRLNHEKAFIPLPGEAPPEPSRFTVTMAIPGFLEAIKDSGSYNFHKQNCKHIERLWGDLELQEYATRKTQMAHLARRKTDPIFNHGKPLASQPDRHPSLLTIHHEFKTASRMLNYWMDQGILENVPSFRKIKPCILHTERDRVLTEEEFKTLLSVSEEWLADAEIGAWETALQQCDQLNLCREKQAQQPGRRQLPHVDRKAGVIRLPDGRHKTRERQKVPISPALAAVLDRIEERRRDDKLANIARGDTEFLDSEGKPINRYTLGNAFKRALKRAGIEDFRWQDFRHCAITRWTKAGIIEVYKKRAAGHATRSQHDKYVHVGDEELVAEFSRCLGWNRPSAVGQAAANVE